MQSRRLPRPFAALVALVLAIPLVAGGAEPNDPLLERQYHLDRVRAPDAWEVGRGYEQVIAVLDTGVDLEHEDLQGRLVPGIDLVDRGSPPDDDNGHGTFVAGVAAANVDNKQGGSGVAPRASIMPVRVLNKEGRGTSDIVAEGIRWATREGATVINLSLADVPGQERSPAQLITTDVELAIRQAALDGVVVVCAAGNEGKDTTPYADDLPALIVGASDRKDRVWEHSNYDDDTLFAPGVGIISTYVGDPYAVADGTSFSAPIVSAGAAILRQSGMDAQQTRRRLIDTARPISEGAGRVDVAAALGVAPRVRSTPKPQPEPKRKRSEEPSEEPNDPKPIPKPSPVGEKDKVAPKPPRIKPVPLPSPTVKPRKAGPPKVAKADRPRKTKPHNAKPQAAVTPTEQRVIAAPPAGTPTPRPLWPFAVAGGLLFVVAVGLAGYVAAKRSG